MRPRLLGLTLLALSLPGSAIADADERVPPVSDDLVRRECGSCHMAFPPAFLPARSWNRLMDGQGDHFGENLRLSADTVAAIRAYLTANAGDRGGSGGRHGLRLPAGEAAPLRITETPAFLRKHDFPERVWRSPKVVTRSNCEACHAGAGKGVFEED